MSHIGFSSHAMTSGHAEHYIKWSSRDALNEEKSIKKNTQQYIYSTQKWNDVKKKKMRSEFQVPKHGCNLFWNHNWAICYEQAPERGCENGQR